MSDTRPRIYSLRRGAVPPPPDAVRVDRRTPWGNQFPCLYETTDPTVLHGRAWAVREFEKYALGRLERQPDWLAPLRGKSLVCWCQSPGDPRPKACHAEVLPRSCCGWPTRRKRPMRRRRRPRDDPRFESRHPPQHVPLPQSAAGEGSGGSGAPWEKPLALPVAECARVTISPQADPDLARRARLWLEVSHVA